MSRILRTLILLACTSACSADTPGKSGADTAPSKAPTKVAKLELPKADPVEALP